MLNEHSTNWITSTVEWDSVKTMEILISSLQGLNYTNVCETAAALQECLLLLPVEVLEANPLQISLFRIRVVNLKP